jgi:hypothetical protein
MYTRSVLPTEKKGSLATAKNELLPERSLSKSCERTGLPFPLTVGPLFASRDLISSAGLH